MSTKQKQQLRIIGGQWKNRKITFPPSVNIRPTPNRVRETLFNWLASHIVNATCLDLFAGSGALGFEALSRGAKHVTMIDKSSVVIKHLRQTALQLKTNHITFIQSEVPKNVHLSSTVDHKPFDIIFLDPPFYQQLIPKTCSWLLENQWMHSTSLIYIESENKIPLNLPSYFNIFKQGRTSQTAYYLIQLDKI